MAGRGEDQMGRGGTEPRRAGIKEKGAFFFLKCVKREMEDERGVGHSRGNGGTVSDSRFCIKRHKSIGGGSRKARGKDGKYAATCV